MHPRSITPSEGTELCYDDSSSAGRSGGGHETARNPGPLTALYLLHGSAESWWRSAARRGRCSAISSATASAAMHCGPCCVAITNRARPPISAEKTTLAAATTAAGGEIVDNLLLARALCVERLTRSPRAHSRTQRKRLSPVVL